MSKRTQDLPRNARDFYATPMEAVFSLAPLMGSNLKFIEPCVGDGRLAGFIEDIFPSTKCVYASDLQPLPEHKASPKGLKFFKHDVFSPEIDWKLIAKHTGADVFITNPPFLNDLPSKRQLNRMIALLASVKPTYLLLPADYTFNIMSADCLRYCTTIVPIGRVKWIEGSKFSSADNFAWFEFDRIAPNETGGPTVLPRQKLKKEI
jgi:hypothetical protein